MDENFVPVGWIVNDSGLSPTQNGYVLFENDFEAGLDELILEPGWQIQTDENGDRFLCNLEQSKPSLQIAIGEANWENYQLEFKVKDTHFVSNAAEILRIDIRENRDVQYIFLLYLVSYQNSTDSFTTDASRVELIKFLGQGEDGESFSADIDAPFEDQWYTVRILADKGHLSFYLDNTLVLNYRDDEYLTGGLIRFYTNDGTCLDNIRVTNIKKP